MTEVARSDREIERNEHHHRHSVSARPLRGLVVMTGLIVALTFVIALACFIGGLWLAWWSARYFHRKAVQTSRSGRLPMLEMPLAVLSFLLVLVAMKIAIMFVLASGLWLVSLSQGSPS